MPLAVLLAADATRPSSIPIVLILLVDDMGYGDPQCFNAQSKIATPHIDRLAASGIRFEHGYSSLLGGPSPALPIDGAPPQMTHENDLNGSPQ